MGRPNLNWIWRTKAGERFLVKEMNRSHVQNTLNWVLRQKDAERAFTARFGHVPMFDQKDGHTWDEWADAFFQRLLDKDLP